MKIVIVGHKIFYKLAFFFLIIVFSLCRPEISFAAWQKYPGNPILTGTGGEWDGVHISNPFVLYIDGKYKMWYGGSIGYTAKIGYAESVNGIDNWQRETEPIILPKADLGWDEKEIGHPNVVYSTSKGYEMWYIAISTRWSGGSDRFRVRYATSSDGISWNIYPGYVLTGTTGAWDSGGIARGLSVILTPKGYEMWYSGVGDTEIWGIGYASSTDGINWVKKPDQAIIKSESWEKNSLSYPNVIYADGLYEMWYAAASSDTSDSIVYAFSNDGVTWQKRLIDNPVLTKGASGFDTVYMVSPSVIKQGNLYKMWYSGYDGYNWRIGYAENVLTEPTPTPTSIPSPTPTPTATPTPTPTPTSLQPLIFLPGLGASWNHKQMILGIPQPQSEWHMSPGVKIYDGLIQTLKNAGYQTEGPGKNLFIFNYNWTQPVSITTNELKDFIQNVVNPPPGAKIDLVGHSMGGFVSRTYVQNNPDHPVDQILTLGSPLKGVPHLYYAWEGGDLKNTLATWTPWQRFALTLLVYLRKSAFSTLAETVQAIAPSLHDLLPTFNYLKQNGHEKPVGEMVIKNEWLTNLNSSLPSHLLSILNNFVALLPASTVRWVHVGPRSWLDEVLNLWVDGKPTGEEEFDVGDITVLAESAQLSGANVVNLEGINHTQLVETTTGIERIISVLGLSPSEIVPAPPISWEPSLIFILASLATISVFDPSGDPVGETDGQSVTIPSATAGEYQVKLTGTGNSNYHLYIGQIVAGQEIWNTISGNINPGEEHIYKINFNPSSPLETPLVDADGSLNLTNARNKIAELRNLLNQANIDKNCKKALLAQIDLALRLLNENRIKSAIIFLYEVRLKINSCGPKKINEITARFLKNQIQEIITNLEQVYIIGETNKGGSYPSRLLEKEIAFAQKDFVRMETKLKKLASQRKVKPDYGALYLLASEKLNRTKQSSSYEAHINALGTKALSKEGLRFFR